MAYRVKGEHEAFQSGKSRRPAAKPKMVPILIPYPGGRYAKILQQMRASPHSVRYADLHAVCRAYFGAPRQQGSSHAVFSTPWQGDPRVNIQGASGKAKAYQVRQVLRAIERLNDRDKDHEP